MENKYYTPTLEEFHVGFEYEQYNGTVWEKLIFDIDYEDEDWNDLYHVNFCIKRSTIRVKYLDREDIESLGFIYDDCFRDGGTSVFYNHTETIGLHFYGTNNIVENKLKLRLLRYNGNPIYQGCVFDGTIKNKSELVKLLKQLGICQL